MHLHSLGYRTDLIFAAFDGQLIDRGHYLVIRTPANPTFYWGNFLLFARPPRPGDYPEWCNLFAAEIGRPPQVRHQTFGWDTSTGEVGAVRPFLEAGFRLNHFMVLTASQVWRPLNYSTEVTVRPLATEADWDQALANQILCREPGHEEAGYRLFKQRQLARYQAMAAAGLGAWFGAFIGQQLVGDLGLFHRQGLGRFQEVETHPDYRRRGIGACMVFEASRYALKHFAVETLVIVADHDSAAARLYTSLGFEPTEQQVGLEWWEQDDND
ncbi:MAG: GNAT family N-acetyltransferase [Chloroflexota bacterium]